MTRWAKTLGTNGWGATPSHYISLVSTMWFDESKVWLPPGEASGRVRLWFRLHGVRNIEPSIPPFWPPLTSTLRFVSPQHFDGEYRCRWEYRPRLTTFDFVVVVVFVFCCCFVLLFFLYHNIEVKHWNDSFNDKGIVWYVDMSTIVCTLLDKGQSDYAWREVILG